MPRLRRAFTRLLVLLLGVFALLAAGGPAQAAPVTVTNGTQFTDTKGAVAHAHGGGVVKVGAYYYWFGENRNADTTGYDSLAANHRPGTYCEAPPLFRRDGVL